MGIRLIAIGNALMDLFALVDAELPRSMGFRVNTTSHLESHRLDTLLPLLSGATMAAAGGAANTARAAALLGMDAFFVGTVGSDAMGMRYDRDLASSGVKTLLTHESAPTGIFCALSHPDGTHTFLVAPSAATLVAGSRRDFERRREDILYIDGFALAGSDLLEAEGRKARAAGMRVAIDLGSKFLVEAHRKELLAAIRRYCDFVFANEDEFKSLAGSSVEDACKTFADFNCSFIVKRGDKGAIFCSQGRIVESPVRAQIPFDETGAGDAFAAGFLVGIARGFAPQRCLRLGNRMAEEAIAVSGLGIDPARIGQVLAAVGL